MCSVMCFLTCGWSLNFWVLAFQGRVLEPSVVFSGTGRIMSWGLLIQHSRGCEAGTGGGGRGECVKGGGVSCVMGYCLLSLLSKWPFQTPGVSTLLFYWPHECVHVLTTCFCFIAGMKFGEVPRRSWAPDHQDDLVCLFSPQTDWTSLNNVIAIVQSQCCVLTGQTGGSSLVIQASKVLAHKNKQLSLDYPLAWKRLNRPWSHWE